MYHPVINTNRMSFANTEFNRESKKYRIFGCCHVETLTQIICWLWFIASIIMAGANYHESGISFGVFREILHALVTGCALYGIANLESELVLFPMFLLGAEMVISSLGYIFSLYGSSYSNIAFEISLGIEDVPAYQIFGIFMIIWTFFLYAIYQCHIYITDKKAAKRMEMPMSLQGCCKSFRNPNVF